MERDLDKIEKLAQEKEEENLRFRIFLKGCDHYEVDRIVHQLNEKYFQEFDCRECGN